MRKIDDAVRAFRLTSPGDVEALRAHSVHDGPRLRHEPPRFSVYADGRLELHFPAFQNADTPKAFAASFAAAIEEHGLSLPPTYMNDWFSFVPKEWVPL